MCMAQPAPVACLLQRTLAVELQRLSVQFRKQQKAYLNRLRSKDGGGNGSSFTLLDEGQRGRQEDDFDPGFSDVQVRQQGRRTWLRQRHGLPPRSAVTCSAPSQLIGRAVPLPKAAGFMAVLVCCLCKPLVAARLCPLAAAALRFGNSWAAVLCTHACHPARLLVPRPSRWTP
jgi:hypothetical protein